MATVRAGSRIELTPEFLVDPHPAYDRMRVEAPAHKVRMAGSDVEVWLVTRWETARALLAGPALTKSAVRAGFPLETIRMPVYSGVAEQLRGNMLHADPPEHTRLRKPVSRVFTPARVAALRAFVERVADELVDRIAGQGHADVVADLARPLPVRVITELLGAPPDRSGDLYRWSQTVVAAPASGEDYAAHVATMTEIRDYLREVVALRRREPDGRLVSALIQARDEQTGEPLLGPEELGATVFLLLFAGLENVGNLIGNGILALLRHPEQLARLRREPALLPRAVAELLRYDSPGNLTTWRFALRDIELGDGVPVRRGEPVLVAMPAVNRDPARFADPHRLDLDRPDNPHLSFGHGAHHCPGRHLARLEGEVAIATVLRRLPDLELAVAPGELAVKRSLLVRGLRALPVRFTPVPVDPRP
jgi:cytochrome P450